MSKAINTQKISNKGYPTDNPCYKQAHEKANQAEINKYGKKRYDELNDIIDDVIPQNELAGKHTKKSRIHISKKIPKKYHNQIKLHEKIEAKYMNECIRKHE